MNIGYFINNFKNLLNIFKKYGTSPESYARSIGVIIGQNCDIGTRNFGSEPFLISIGDHVQITSGVSFITHDGGVWIFHNIDPTFDVFGRIKIGSNTYIGYNTTIMPGITIGNNCVIGACSLVTKSIPDNTVAAGVPCRHICSKEDYFQRMSKINAKTKLMKWKDKKKILIALDNERLIIKNLLVNEGS